MSLGSFAGGFASGFTAMKNAAQKKDKPAKPAAKAQPMGHDADKADNEMPSYADGGLVCVSHPKLGTHDSLGMFGWQRQSMKK